MFGGWKGVSSKEYSARVNALFAGGGGTPGTPVPGVPVRGQTTSPMCLCELQRRGDKARKK